MIEFGIEPVIRSVTLLTTCREFSCDVIGAGRRLVISGMTRIAIR